MVGVFYSYSVHTFANQCYDNSVCLHWDINHMLGQTLSVIVLSLMPLQDVLSSRISIIDDKSLDSK